MQSEPNPQQIDPGEVGIAPENEELGHIYKQVVREVLARIDQRLAELERSTAPDPSQVQRGTSGSVAWIGDWIMLRSWAKRGLLGLLLSAGIVGAALAWQALDRDTVKSLATRVTPQFVLNLVSAKENQDAAVVQEATTQEATTHDATAQEAVPAVTMQAATEAAPAASPMTTDADGRNPVSAASASSSAASDQTMLIQRMARDIEGLTQGMEQLKTSQDQMSRDNARAAEQLRASEDQLIRTILRMSDQTAQPKNPQARTPQDRNAQAKNAAPPPRTRPRSQVPSFLSRGAT